MERVKVIGPFFFRGCGAEDQWITGVVRVAFRSEARAGVKSEVGGIETVYEFGKGPVMMVLTVIAALL